MGLFWGCSIASSQVGTAVENILLAAVGLASFFSALVPGVAGAQSITVEKGQEFEVKAAVVPYAFYNENLKFGAGPVLFTNGWLQEQMSLIASGFLTSNGSRSVFMLGRDTQLPLLDRLFLDSWVSFGNFDEFESYIDGNPDFPDERAGSNDSREDNFVETSGDDDFFQLNFKYLLPVGHGRDTIINTYVMDNGLLHEGATGGERWNPLRSGRTYLQAEAFFRSQDLDGDAADADLETNGIRFSLHYDNTDFVPNPSRGSSQEIALARDWGKLGSDAPWTVFEAEYSHYFNLPTRPGLRQAVLAFNFWTADVLTWDSGNETPHRPPLFAGATLGGLYRLRGFPAARFHDKSAIYYTAELRVIPDWNPLGRGSWAEWAEIAWLQLVPFVEVGRVADTWNLNELHSDMKWDVGLGLRAMVKGLILRLDIAFSDEEAGVVMMVGQPF